MSDHKIGEIHARAMLQLGLVELRNASGFDQSNVQDDIRRSMYDARQELHSEQNAQPQVEQSPTLELEQAP